MTTILLIDSIDIPAGSTIGYAEGVGEDGERHRIAGDWRPLREIGEEIAYTNEPVEAEIEDWQLLS